VAGKKVVGFFGSRDSSRASVVADEGFAPEKFQSNGQIVP